MAKNPQQSRLKQRKGNGKQVKNAPMKKVKSQVSRRCVKKDEFFNVRKNIANSVDAIKQKVRELKKDREKHSVELHHKFKPLTDRLDDISKTASSIAEQKHESVTSEAQTSRNTEQKLRGVASSNEKDDISDSEESITSSESEYEEARSVETPRVRSKISR
jgi:hypothetical protein